MITPHRRSFLTTAGAAATIAGLGDLGFLTKMRPVRADEARVDPSTVRFHADVEPLVRLLEETDRSKLIEIVADRIEKGLSYQTLLAAVQLAAIRNVQPRPSVGHKFHAVLVVNSAHLASLASPDEHRWLPIFWAVDYFKSAQARDVQENNWTMAAVREDEIPSPSKAREAFVTSMDRWDEEAADAAAAGLARSVGTDGIYELFYRYGMRDFRSIGHKAIYVANSRRTLECIGRQHTEPVVRSLAYALLMHEGSNPAERDAEADRPFRRNQELVKRLGPTWKDGQLDDGATRQILAALRSESPESMSELVVDQLQRGVSPQSVWDGLLVGASEMLMKQPAIVPLHAVTTANAARYAFDATGDEVTRQMVLLQLASFLPMFRDAMTGRGRVADVTVEDLNDSSDPKAKADDVVSAIFDQLGSDRLAAARQTKAYLAAGQSAESVIDAARALVFLKGRDAHDYKFSSALLEDYHQISPAWRDTYLAAGMYLLPSSRAKDNDLVARTRAALA